jgi:hypothetical protein
MSATVSNLIQQMLGLSEFIEEDKQNTEPDSPESLAKGVKKFFDLKDQVDFEKNIREKIKSSKFFQLPELFEKIIGEINY